jgi:hydroxycarboxylate dehydrogenase B
VFLAASPQTPPDDLEGRCMAVVKSDVLTAVVADIFIAHCVPEPAARIVAEHLVDADTCGVHSHGVIRVRQYIEAIEAKRVVADAELTVLREEVSTAVLDGGFGFGQVMARGAMEFAIKRAESTGVAAVTLVNCGHTGRLGAYTEQAALHGMAAMMFNNTGGCGQWVAPFGGAAGRLATDPISIAVPAAAGDPLVLDIATSVAPEGKVRSMLTAGKPIPEGWVIDHRGNPTTNPADLYGPPRGALLPFGGHKGFGLSMVVDALAGGLSGAGCCTTTDTPMAGITDGVLIVVLNVAAFCPLDTFLHLVRRQIAHVKSCPPAAGTLQVIVPGELEGRTRRERLRDGIPIEPGTWELLREDARRAGVALP